MKNKITDETLKNLFCEMRDNDGKGIPDFGRLAGSPEPARRKSAVWRIAAAAAIVILLGAIASLLVPSTDNAATRANASKNTEGAVQTSSPVQENWSLISDWQASTDNLLASTSARSDSTFATPTDALLEFSTSYNQ